MFKKASKSQSRARIALMGPSGTGKTWSALKLARLIAGPAGKIAVIDTERGSASLYAGDVADFDVCELPSFSPEQYIKAMSAASGYAVIVVDSLSHAWAGKDGVLEIVDNAAARSKGNKFAAWREGTPQQNALVDAILQSPAHVICTMRTKAEYVLEDENGKKVPRKIGMAPIQRDQIEYEFSLCADLDFDHKIMVTKTRCAALDRAVINPPGNVEKLAEVLKAWLTSGAPVDARSLLAPAVRELLALIDKVSTPEALELAKQNANGKRKGMTQPEKDAVTAAFKAAEARCATAPAPDDDPTGGDPDGTRDLFEADDPAHAHDS